MLFYALINEEFKVCLPIHRFPQDPFPIENINFFLYQTYILTGNFKQNKCLPLNIYCSEGLFLSQQKSSCFKNPSLAYGQQDPYMFTENTYDTGKQTQNVKEAQDIELDSTKRMKRKGRRHF